MGILIEMSKWGHLTTYILHEITWQVLDGFIEFQFLSLLHL